MKSNFSQNVCRQLAEQLINEQTEVMKHVAELNSIKRRITHTKTKLISDLALGNVFRIHDKKSLVTGVHSVVTLHSMVVALDLCECPDSVACGKKLTKRENELLSEYRMAYDFNRLCKDDGWDKELREIAMELATMNPQIHPLDVLVYEIDFEYSMKPEFFTQTGIWVGKGKMLEDVICKSVNNNKHKKN